jgi:hypothetical protein
MGRSNPLCVGALFFTFVHLSYRLTYSSTSLYIGTQKIDSSIPRITDPLTDELLSRGHGIGEGFCFSR